MKKRKDLTVPVACRVSLELREQFEVTADELEISLAEYVATLVTNSPHGAEMETLQRRIRDLEAQLDEKLRRERDHVWSGEPYASLLEQVLLNERILEGIYAQQGENPVPSGQLEKSGFQFSVLLKASLVESLHYYILGRYSWAFTDNTKKSVIIIKRD